MRMAVLAVFQSRPRLQCRGSNSWRPLSLIGGKIYLFLPTRSPWFFFSRNLNCTVVWSTICQSYSQLIWPKRREENLRPSLLILDEAFDGLDKSSRVELASMLESFFDESPRALVTFPKALAYPWCFLIVMTLSMFCQFVWMLFMHCVCRFVPSHVGLPRSKVMIVHRLEDLVPLPSSVLLLGQGDGTDHRLSAAWWDIIWHAAKLLMVEWNCHVRHY